MGSMIRISICLSDLPKDKITTASNQKKYINLVVDERRMPDAYDNTHTVYVSQTKEERTAGEKKVYVGNGKEHVFNNSGNQQQSQQQPSTPQSNTYNNPSTGSVDDLPF